MPRLERGLSGVEPERRPSALPHPNSAPALPRQAQPCHAAPRPAKSVLVGGAEPPMRPSELPATSVAPCLAGPCVASPRIAEPRQASSVRAPDSNRRVCHPRYRSNEPKPCPTEPGHALPSRAWPRARVGRESNPTYDHPRHPLKKPAQASPNAPSTQQPQPQSDQSEQPPPQSHAQPNATARPSAD